MKLENNICVACLHGYAFEEKKISFICNVRGCECVGIYSLSILEWKSKLFNKLKNGIIAFDVPHFDLSQYWKRQLPFMLKSSFFFFKIN